MTGERKTDLAVDLKTVAAVEVGQLEHRAETGCRAVDHISAAGVFAIRVGARGTDDQVGKAIAVDIAGAADGHPGLVVCPIAVDLEAVAAVKGSEFDDRRKGHDTTPHYICKSTLQRPSAMAAGTSILRGRCWQGPQPLPYHAGSAIRSIESRSGPLLSGTNTTPIRRAPVGLRVSSRGRADASKRRRSNRCASRRALTAGEKSALRRHPQPPRGA